MLRAADRFSLLPRAQTFVRAGMGKKKSGTDGHQPKKSTADAPQRGQEFAFCLPTSSRSLRKSIDIRP